MPIRPELRALYPPDWPQISRRIRFERAGNRCEWCGARPCFAARAERRHNGHVAFRRPA